MRVALVAATVALATIMLVTVIAVALLGKALTLALFGNALALLDQALLGGIAMFIHFALRHVAMHLLMLVIIVIRDNRPDHSQP